MKNICICATIVACALASVAAPDAAAPAKTAAEKSAAAIKAYQNLSPAEKQAKIRARMERRAKRIAEKGGFVVQAPKGKVFRVFSAQKFATKDDLSESMGVLSDQVRIPVEWKDVDTAETKPGKICQVANADGRGGAALVLIDDPDEPRMLIAPENGWAMVNVAALRSGDTKRTTFVRRLKQEFWRATCILLGAYESSSKPCLLTLVAGNDDLDRNVCIIPSVEPLPKVSVAARALGIIPCRCLIYEDACREGWAPAPTNDYQKAIWESVKAEQSKDPEKAIKIKYDPKKGK